MARTILVRIYPETADLLSALSERVDVPRPSFVAKLAERYGERVALELDSPGVVSAEPTAESEVGR